MWKLGYLLFIILNIAAFLVPKRLSKIEIYATSFFALTYGLTVDMILDLHYDFYGYLKEGFQWLGLIGLFLYFPAVSILFLNLYPIKSNTIKKILYILGWTVFSVVIEWFCVKINYFYYNEWKLWYSAICYPIIFLMLLINLKLVRNLIKETYK